MAAPGGSGTSLTEASGAKADLSADFLAEFAWVQSGAVSEPPAHGRAGVLPRVVSEDGPNAEWLENSRQTTGGMAVEVPDVGKVPETFAKDFASSEPMRIPTDTVGSRDIDAAPRASLALTRPDPKTQPIALPEQTARSLVPAVSGGVSKFEQSKSPASNAELAAKNLMPARPVTEDTLKVGIMRREEVGARALVQEVAGRPGVQPKVGANGKIETLAKTVSGRPETQLGPSAMEAHLEAIASNGRSGFPSASTDVQFGPRFEAPDPLAARHLTAHSGTTNSPPGLGPPETESPRLSPRSLASEPVIPVRRDEPATVEVIVRSATLQTPAVAQLPGIQTSGPRSPDAGPIALHQSVPTSNDLEQLTLRNVPDIRAHIELAGGSETSLNLRNAAPGLQDSAAHSGLRPPTSTDNSSAPTFTSPSRRDLVPGTTSTERTPANLSPETQGSHLTKFESAGRLQSPNPHMRKVGAASSALPASPAASVQTAAPGNPPETVADPLVPPARQSPVPATAPAGSGGADPLFGDATADLDLSAPTTGRDAPDGTRRTDAPAVRADVQSRAVLGQIADAARTLSDGSVEVRLSPEELGRVRLSLSPGDMGLTIHVAAERPETLELIRRHIDLLAADLRREGYDGATFSFEQEPRAGDDTPRRPREQDAHAGSTGQWTEAEKTVRTVPEGRLDLRL
jgi:Flagellar hook-length control protein FliK